MQTGSTLGYYNPLPLGITSSSLFQYIYNLHIKFQNFCRSVPCSIIYFELSRPSPSASMSFSCWFLAFSSSLNQGTLWLLPSLCSLVGKSWHKWCPPHFQHFAGCFIFTHSISFESSCLECFLTYFLDKCPIIDPLSLPL